MAEKKAKAKSDRLAVGVKPEAAARIREIQAETKAKAGFAPTASAVVEAAVLAYKPGK